MHAENQWQDVSSCCRERLLPEPFKKCCQRLQLRKGSAHSSMLGAHAFHAKDARCSQAELGKILERHCFVRETGLEKTLHDAAADMTVKLGSAGVHVYPETHTYPIVWA